jgi:hypothetical protein
VRYILGYAARECGTDFRRREKEREDSQMAEPEWELLTVQGLSMTDETASEFVGTFVIHRTGHTEPVEQVRLRVKRSVLEEVSRTLQRLLTRSTRFSR